MRCDACGQFSDTIKPVTVAIHYSMGPLTQWLCWSCRDGEHDAGPKFRAARNETTEES